MAPSDNDRGSTRLKDAEVARLKEEEADNNEEKNVEDIRCPFRQTKSS